MLNSAAPSPSWADPGFGRGADTSADDVDLSIWRERSRAWQERELEQALANFTFVANVTTLAPDCRFAGDAETLVARYEGLPFAAIAFHSQNRTGDRDTISRRITALTRRLIAPDETFYCLVDEEQRPLVASAFLVLENYEEWQMLFRGGVSTLSSGNATPLTSADLAEMEALARREGMMAFEQDPLSRGPWYGVRRDGTLIAQGGTHLMLRHAAEIGNIVTARSHRRRGYGSRIVAALVRDLHARGRGVFLQVFKDNEAAIACYAKMGFERLRTMYLMRCQLEISS